MLLDTMRRHSRSFIIYLVFGVLIAVFVVNFGPQSAGCGAEIGSAGSIAGRDLTPNDINYAISISGIRRRSVDDTQMAQLKAWAIDRFVARELLAREAERRGLRISDKKIQHMLVKGRYLALGTPRLLVRNENNDFDYDLFSRYVRFNWGITVKKFKNQQRRELLAETLRDALRAAVQVSDAEVKSTYDQLSTQAKLAYVRFSPAEFRDQVAVTDAKIAAYVKAHEADLKKHYEANKTRYSKLPAQVKLSVIKVAFDKAEDKPQAIAKAKAALKRLGTEDFAKVAKDVSDDDSAKTGGLLGWRNATKPGFGGKNVAEALKTLAKDKTSAVIEGDVNKGAGATWILKVTGNRKGDVTFAQAKDEIAREQLLDTTSKRLAQEAAATYVKRAKAGEKLSTMFSSDDDDKADSDDVKTDSDKKATATQPASKKSPLRLRTTAFFSRSPYNLVTGIGISKPLMKAAFTLKVGQVAPKPFTVGSMIYLVQVKDRHQSDAKAWMTRKADIIERFESQKAEQELRAFTYALCQKAAKNNELRISSSVLLPPLPPGATHAKNAKPGFKYVPCQTLKPTPTGAGLGGGARGFGGDRGYGRRPF
ncbi:MAG: SurA N-terminal domain-containing protein [Deltaproteobacteria bacterium]|nr:SurA N-terminal domain-containing protein [Deltaproteobacteria bacterium]